ncbi:pyridoxal-phosphate dependent enzyme [Leifsonia sp. H3M29-4]|uniref:pyridoxal-phosphate dependent enzyme n=1 Tax=Salinibacterium metalliresistens TaxID=3031321 RepID=UPI0023DC406D|nr:pyridoxal-phosphate dependent enzyme [Salinibacterium metalliresistens]MDF1479401.1 pyridoxal-phosphate dependent enzyme [Salinibacterium metalliresistens]
MSPYLGYLVHPITGERVAEEHAYLPTAIDGGHVYAVPQYDLGAMRGLETTDDPGLFRYRALLPIDDGPVVTLQEGNTPLLPVSRVGESLGIPSLFVKDESRNPTWSYKDRLAAVAVTKAVQQGRDTVVVSSTGNHGAAVAAYAARAGIRCVVLTLASVPQAMKTLMQSYGAETVAVETPTDRWVLMRQLVEQRNWVPMSGFVGPPSGSNPFGCEGYKTIAYELHAQLGEVPDVVVAPVAYGDAIAGLQRGFADLVTLGLTSRVPRLVASEPFGPYERALREGFDPTAVVAAGSSVSFSIATPSATWQGWNALASTGGAAASATDEQTMAAQHALASSEGVFLEASSSTTVAVLPELRARGVISETDTVVLLGTSTGLKDVPTTAARLPAVPVIEPTLAALDAALATVSGRGPVR